MGDALNIRGGDLHGTVLNFDHVIQNLRVTGTESVHGRSPMDPACIRFALG